MKRWSTNAIKSMIEEDIKQIKEEIVHLEGLLKIKKEELKDAKKSYREVSRMLLKETDK